MTSRSFWSGIALIAALVLPAALDAGDGGPNDGWRPARSSPMTPPMQGPAVSAASVPGDTAPPTTHHSPLTPAGPPFGDADVPESVLQKSVIAPGPVPCGAAGDPCLKCGHGHEGHPLKHVHDRLVKDVRRHHRGAVYWHQKHNRHLLHPTCPPHWHAAWGYHPTCWRPFPPVSCPYPSAVGIPSDAIPIESDHEPDPPMAPPLPLPPPLPDGSDETTAVPR